MPPTKSPIGRPFTSETARQAQARGVLAHREANARLRAKLAGMLPRLSPRLHRRIAARLGIQAVLGLLIDHEDDLAAARMRRGKP